MQKIIYSAFLLLTFVLYAEDNLLESYDNAQESYRNDENEEAIQRFNRFIESNPESDKADDSLWYLGRLYNRLGDIDQAKEYFEEVLSLEDSNRITEAFYDLSKILDDQQDYQRIIELFPLIYPMEEADSYTVKALPMVVNSYYKLVFNNRNSRAGSWAEEMLQQALTLVENYRDKEYANEIQEDLADLNAKILIRLSVVTASKEDYVSYLNKALEQLDKDLQRGFISNESADNYREKINESLAGAFSLDYQVETSGEYNGMTNEMGFQVDSKIKGTHELSNIQEFQWSVK
ncbi:MAG: tetratricopeptide repeat protein [Spirochaetaceae bacterium]|jgi:tetratricopeptide (TPR) repeat protein|nr:tetratricopeptide repeat protein [Spirochaetaceae bacterium]